MLVRRIVMEDRTYVYIDDGHVYHLFDSSLGTSTGTNLPR